MPQSTTPSILSNVDSIQYSFDMQPLPANLSPITPAPMSSRAEAEIVELIANRSFAPGQRLVEAELAAYFGLSRVPVREALRRLETQGIVRIVPHRGAHVTVFDEVRIARVAEVRFALEVISTRYAMKSLAADPSLVTGLDQVVAEMGRLRSTADRMGVYRKDIAYHTEVCRISGNDVVAKLWESLSRHVYICFGHLTDLYPDLDSIVQTHVDHRSFMLRGEFDHLEEFVAGHIGGLPDAARR